jgi:hypothetical protein
LNLVLRGSGQLGPNGLSGAGHKRRRHGTNAIGKATSDERQQRRGRKDKNLYALTSRPLAQSTKSSTGMEDGPFMASAWRYAMPL